ncbi:phage tail sheath C-terminal domain-containing protein [Mesorhizobium sp. KR1-2]|uniref:phage tail sheath C-terminal domain-containing protein n=1 Tax=Mesorhizobium sp. KR1-2 TaxID=3156609 RepID=UPI0032B621FC
MSISFNQIPINLRVPGAYLEIDNSQAVTGLGILPAKALVIGQMLPIGTGEALKATRILSNKQAIGLYGRGSMLARMLDKAKRANEFVELWAIPLADLPAGIAATGTIAVSGTATSAGMISLLIAGRLVRIGVQAGQAATATATAIVAAISADPDLPVTAAVDSETATLVNLTARHKGLCGNDLDIRLNYYRGDQTPAGLSLEVTAMTGGTGNPDIAPVFDAIGDEWFTDFVTPYSDAPNLDVLEDELASRFGPMRMIDGHAYAATGGTHGEISSVGESRNSPHLSMLGLSGSPTPAEEIASVLGVVCAFALANDPARPVQTLTLPGVLAPALEDRFSAAERNLLLHSGISTATVDAGGNVVIERVCTTYRETATGLDDPSYLNIETLKTLTYLRYDTRTFFWRKYPRHKLADDGTRFGPGQPVMTPKVAKAELVGRFILWEEAGLVEGREQFKADLYVERDGSDKDRLNAIIPPDIINQLRVFAGLVQFRL